MEGIFHVYNRTIAKEPALRSHSMQKRFLSVSNYYRFPQKLKFSAFSSLNIETKFEYIENYLNKPPLVKILAFAIMPNHYHFLLKTTSNMEKSEFISKIQNSFAKYYNLLHDRDGSLFQSQYKSRIINSNVDLFAVSKYIHLNPVEAKIVELEKLPFAYSTSLRYYQKSDKSGFIESKIILNTFGGFERYWDYISTRQVEEML